MSSSANSLTGKRVRDLFISKDTEDLKAWVCICGKKRRIIEIRWTYLTNHDHQQHLEQYESAAKGSFLATSSQTSFDVLTGSLQWKKYGEGDWVATGYHP